jgi:hypothetical protein
MSDEHDRPEGLHHEHDLPEHEPLEEPEQSASATLDRVRQGSNNVVLLAHQRLGEVKEHLDNGRFTQASNVLREVVHKVDHLASAEQSFAVFAGCRVVRVRELAPGVGITNRGVVREVRNISEHGDDCPGAVFEVTYNDGETDHFQGVAEVLVNPDE